MGGSHETPFKMKGSGHYGLGNSSPAKAKSSPAKDHEKDDKGKVIKHPGVNQWGETPEEYKKRVTEMGLREPDKETE